MKRIRRYFIGVPIGSKCTGTVHFFGLSSRRLKEMGIITEEAGDYIYHGPDGIGPPMELLLEDQQAAA